MRTARPAAWPPHPFFQLRAHPLDMLAPCLIFLDGDGPADPLVARERCYVFPGRQCLCVGRERFSEINRKVMYDSPGDSNGRHRVISQAGCPTLAASLFLRLGWEASKEVLIKLILLTCIPSGAKARLDFAAFAARLKPCPFKASTELGVP